jgi:hypothetical protein
MKKEITSILFEVVFYGFVLCISQSSFSQESCFIRGQIIEEVLQKPIEGTSIIISGIDRVTHSDNKGIFQLENIPQGKYVLEIHALNFQIKKIPIVISKNVNLDLGVLFLEKKIEEQVFSNLISLDDNELLDDVIGGANNITGLLQSSKSVFLRTAAFSFGQARFKVRGYDSNERLVSINGIPMNKFYDGRPQWSNWGGLNDVLRNQTSSHGIGFANFSGSHIGGYINMNTRASAYRKGTSTSFAGTNGSYRGRLMFSHFSGTLKKQWSYAVSFSTRFANSGFVEGTPYKSWSGFLAVEKKFGKNHSVNFTGIYTPNIRGKSAPLTEEIYRIKGNNYNSYWGYQDSSIRNSRVKKVVEPIVIISHDWQVHKKFKLSTSIAYQFGFISNSRLGYRNSDNPDPAYYKKLPSYYLRFHSKPDYATAYLALKEFQENGQINWGDFYSTNATTDVVNYYLFNDKNENSKLMFHPSFEYELNKKYSLSGGVSFVSSKSKNYAELIDTFGGTGFIDTDPFLDGVESQNNLKNPNRIVSEGDKFSYSYDLYSENINCYGQFNMSSYQWDVVFSAAFERVNYQRNGLYQSGAFADNSFGLGKNIGFTGFNIKSKIDYKISGRNLINMSFGYFSQPPYQKQIFTNVRYNHNIVPEIKPLEKISLESSYEHRLPSIKFQATGYFTKFKNETEINFTYADGLKRDEADFVSQVVTGIEKLHLGAEFGLEWKASETIKIFGVAALGNFKYVNNPKLYIDSDAYKGEDRFFGNTFIKNFKISGTPQNAYSIGFEYRDPKYWWYQINGNFLKDNYLQIAPLIRTQNFYTDSDGVPFIDPETGEEVSEEKIAELWKQEKFPPLFLLNVVGGKSWKINDSYLGLFLSVNNILNKVYKTGGFEQSRNANFQNYVNDNSLERPLFAPKYWYSQGTSYYWILSYRF